MRITNARLKTRPLVSLSLGVASSLFAAGTLYFATSDAMLRAQFVTAFDAYSETSFTSNTQPKAASAAAIPLAAAEDVWLGSAEHAATLSENIRPASWSGPLAIGNEISISGPDGRRAFEVIATAELPAEGVTHIAHSAANSGLLLVTVREKDPKGGQLLRFIIDRKDATSFGSKPVPPRTL